MPNFLLLLVSAVMILALIGMIVCAKKQRTNPNAQPVAVALLVIVIACGISIMVMTNSFGGGDTQALIENETRYACAKAEVLGGFLKEKYPGEKVLVIAERDFGTNKRTERLIDALKKGLGGADIVIDTITLANTGNMPPEEEMMMPIEEMMTAEDFNKLLDKHRDCQLVITMIGLPRDAANMRVWKMPPAQRQKIALLNGDVGSMQQAIASGFIVGAVSYKPGVQYSEAPAPRDVQKAFEERYLLVHPGNIKEIAAEHKGLFR